MMEGFEECLMEGVMGDTAKCVWCKNVPGEVRL